MPAMAAPISLTAVMNRHLQQQLFSIYQPLPEGGGRANLGLEDTPHPPTPHTHPSLAKPLCTPHEPKEGVSTPKAATLIKPCLYEGA